MSYTRSNGTTTPNLAGFLSFNGLQINDGTFVLTRCDLFDGPPIRPSVTQLPSDQGGIATQAFYDPWEFVIEGYLTVPVLADVWGAKDDLRGSFNLSAGLQTLTINTSGWSASRQVSARVNGPIVFAEPNMLDKNVPDRDFVIPMMAPDPRIYATTQQSVTVTSTSLTNNGNTGTPITVRFNGAQTNPQIVDPSGRKIRYLGTIASGHWVEVNTYANGVTTAVDDTGANVYSALTDARASIITPGSSTWVASNSSGAGSTLAKFRDAYA